MTSSFPSFGQNITTLAGNGSATYGGDGGPSVNAQLNFPSGLFVDSLDNLFISDYYNHRIRKITPNGIITSVAGNGSLGYDGDGGAAVNAKITISGKVAVSNTGIIYFANLAGSTIRRIGLDGVVTTIAGTGNIGVGGDGGPARDAEFYNPSNVALDAFDNLYVVDYSHRVRKIDAAGMISTVVGTDTAGFTGDGGSAASAELNSPSGIVLDATGNLYIADLFNHRIRKVNSTGIITTVAGTGNQGFSGNNGLATNADINTPTDVTVDNQGNIYFADYGNQLVRKISVDGIISIVAGNGNPGFSGDGGLATDAQLYNVYGVAVNANSTIFMSDQGNNRIRQINAPKAVAPAVSLVCIPTNLTDSVQQISTCTVSRDTPSSKTLSVNLSLPVSSTRYTSNCISPIFIPVNATSASCSITATPNTVPGDGNAVAQISIAPPNEDEQYSTVSSTVQIVIVDDDSPADSVKRVPTLNIWALMILSLFLIVPAYLCSSCARDGKNL